jgi:hypothetical protein
MFFALPPVASLLISIINNEWVFLKFAKFKPFLIMINSNLIGPIHFWIHSRHNPVDIGPVHQ